MSIADYSTAFILYRLRSVNCIVDSTVFNTVLSTMQFTERSLYRIKAVE